MVVQPFIHDSTVIAHFVSALCVVWWPWDFTSWLWNGIASCVCRGK